MNGGAHKCLVLVVNQLKFLLVLTLLLNNNTVTVKGPKGELTRSFNSDMKLTVEENVITC